MVGMHLILPLQLRVPVDEEKTVKEKTGAKETNLVKEAALLKEANIVKELVRAGTKETHPTKLSTPSKVAATMRETHPAKAIALVKVTAPVEPAGPAKAIVPVKGAVSKVNAEEKSMVEEKVVVKDCPCLRPVRLIMCADCGVTFAGRVRAECSTHPRCSPHFALNVGDGDIRTSQNVFESNSVSAEACLQ